MKKIRHFMLMALGLGLVSIGCNQGDNGDGIPVDNRANVVGAYPVKVTVPGLGDIYTDLAIVKQGDNDLKASASVDVPGSGRMNLSLTLSELVEHNTKSEGYGYHFKIAEQELTIPGMEAAVALKGTGKYDGHDGRVYKGLTESTFVTFEIADASGTVTVKVETGEKPEATADHRNNVVSNYPVKITVPVVGDLYTNLKLIKEGDSDLKASASVDIIGMGKFSFDIIFSELEELMLPDVAGGPTFGYGFKIASQELSITGTPLIMTGTGEYGGFDGRVEVGAAEGPFISFEAADASGNVTVKVETGEEPVINGREVVEGTYPVRISIRTPSIDVIVPDTFSDIKITKDSNRNLRASFAVNAATMKGEIDLVLSDLKEYSKDGAKGFYFKILPQNIYGSRVNGEGLINVSGSDAYIDFIIVDNSIGFRLQVSPDDRPINGRDAVEGTYPVNVAYYPLYIDVIYHAQTDLQISAEGSNKLKLSGPIFIQARKTTIDLDLVLSGLKAYTEDGAEGFSFKIGSQIQEGFGTVDGSGIVYMNGSERYISFDVRGMETMAPRMSIVSDPRALNPDPRKDF